MFFWKKKPKLQEICSVICDNDQCFFNTERRCGNKKITITPDGKCADFLERGEMAFFLMQKKKVKK